MPSPTAHTPALTAEQRIGHQFRSAREAAGLSQETSAAALGTRQSTVSAWELGRNLPRAGSLAAIARLYGVTVTDLIGDDQ